MICYYSAPLSTLVTVIKRKDASSLHPPLCVMNFFNMCCWFSYGIVRPIAPLAAGVSTCLASMLATYTSVQATVLIFITVGNILAGRL